MQTGTPWLRLVPDLDRVMIVPTAEVARLGLGLTHGPTVGITAGDMSKAVLVQRVVVDQMPGAPTAKPTVTIRFQ